MVIKKTVIGVVETVLINGKKHKARIDTGARMSSIDKKLAKSHKLGPILKRTKIKSAHGESVRPVVKIEVKIGKRKIKASFNLADRRHMKYSVLIGRNILKKGFLIDVTK